MTDDLSPVGTDDMTDDYRAGFLDGLATAMRVLENAIDRMDSVPLEVLGDSLDIKDELGIAIEAASLALTTMRENLAEMALEFDIEGELYCTCGHDDCPAPKRPEEKL